MDGWNAFFALAILVAVVIAICYVLSMVGFYAFMKANPEDFPPSQGPVSQRIIQLFDARKDGKVWFAKRDHRTIGAVAFAIGIWGFMLAAVSGRATDFGRSGSLISILGLVTAFIGSVHAKGLFELRHAIDPAIAEAVRRSTYEDPLVCCIVFSAGIPVDRASASRIRAD